MKPLFSLPSFKQQTLVLGICLLMVCVAIVQLNIRKTFKLYDSYRDQVERINVAATAPARIANLRKKLAYSQQSNLKPYNRELLLEKVTEFCRNNHMLVRAFPEAQVTVQGENSVVTNQIEIEGSFKDMVRLVYMLEAQEKQGSIGSLRFFVYKDRIAKRTVLRSQITLRNLES